MDKRKRGRPRATSTDRLELQIPTEYKAKLDEVLERGGFDSASAWVREQIAQAYAAIDRTVHEPTLPGMDVAQALAELERRHIALDELSSLLAGDEHLTRLGLEHQRPVLTEIAAYEEEHRADRACAAILAERGITLHELVDVITSPREVKRLGLLGDIEHELRAYLGRHRERS